MPVYCNFAQERAALQAAVTGKLELTQGDPSKYELVKDEVEHLLQKLEELETEEDAVDEANGMGPPEEYDESPRFLPTIMEVDEDTDMSQLYLDDEYHTGSEEGVEENEYHSEAVLGEDEDAIPMVCFRHCEAEECKHCKGKYQGKGY
ncbi:hypothetical protein BDV59DRAFT_198648 [Aspergillus ambiguus]|uniref:uncharacterized protein n=1 Tax=Aspergillus ambiguus TaxID=176160 RepID=UPI003CCDF73D